MSETYDRERPSFEDANNVTVKRCFYAYEFTIPYTQGKDVADVGCANGYGSVEMAKTAKTVLGLDYSEATVSGNLETYRDIKNLSFRACRVPPLILEDNSVDLVTAFQFIEHIHLRLKFMQEVKRVLKPGGVFICTTPNAKMSIARNPFHVHEYTFAEMKEEAGKVFDSFELKGLNGNEKVNKYYEDNQTWAKRILRFDPLGLHKLIPSALLVKPYNYLTSKMRRNLKATNTDTMNISTSDFVLQNDELDQCWDIYLIAKK